MFLLRLYPFKKQRCLDDRCTMLHGGATVNKNVISGNGLEKWWAAENQISNAVSAGAAGKNRAAVGEKSGPAMPVLW